MEVPLRFPLARGWRWLALAPPCLAFLFALRPAMAQDSAPPTPMASPDAGVVSIGGQVVMRLRASAGGMSAEQRVDAIEDRLTMIVSVPDIQTSSVVVYAPSGKPPVIYVLGRRLITIDPITVKAAGGGDAKQLAVLWAKRLQQILPRVDIRLPDEPEPVAPANPPLLVTSDLSQVGGNIGYVVFRGKSVMRMAGVQPGGITAVERADMLARRLDRLAYKLDTSAPDAVDVMGISLGGSGAGSAGETKPSAKAAADMNPPNPGRKMSLPPPELNAEILIGGREFYTVTPADCKAGCFAGTPMSLASVWAKNIRAAMGMPPSGAPAPPQSPPAPSTPPVPAAPSQSQPAPQSPPPPPSAGAPAVPPAPPATAAPPSTSTPTPPSEPAGPSAPAQAG